jgi:Cu+-exporting ATPase
VNALLALDWTPDRVAAVAAGILLLVVLYVFFFGRRRFVVPSELRIAPEVKVVVEGGYSPDVVRARVGAPLRLVFDRRDTSPCTDEVVFPDFGIRRALAPNAKTVVEIRPQKAGTFPFSCGMNMLHGRIEVSP